MPKVISSDSEEGPPPREPLPQPKAQPSDPIWYNIPTGSSLPGRVVAFEYDDDNDAPLIVLRGGPEGKGPVFYWTPSDSLLEHINCGALVYNLIMTDDPIRPRVTFSEVDYNYTPAGGGPAVDPQLDDLVEEARGGGPGSKSQPTQKADGQQREEPERGAVMELVEFGFEYLDARLRTVARRVEVRARPLGVRVAPVERELQGVRVLAVARDAAQARVARQARGEDRAVHPGRRHPLG